MRDITDLIIVGFLVGLAFFGILHFTYDEPEPVEEIPTIIVRIVDKNQVIHSRIGVIQDGEVIIQLSGKRI
jgi:hypothetical protein